MVAKKTSRTGAAKSPANYTFRRIFTANANIREGCLGVWEVIGGKDSYQIALEQSAGVGGIGIAHAPTPTIVPGRWVGLASTLLR